MQQKETGDEDPIGDQITLKIKFPKQHNTKIQKFNSKKKYLLLNSKVF